MKIDVTGVTAARIKNNIGRGTFLGSHDFKNADIILVFFILLLWGVVLSIFFRGGVRINMQGGGYDE